MNKIIYAYEAIHQEIEELKDKMSSLKDKFNIVVICSECKKIRLTDGSWVKYSDSHPANFFSSGLSHGYCPGCAKTIMDAVRRK